MNPPTTSHILDKPVRMGRYIMEGLNHLLWPALCDRCGCSILQDDKRLCQECWNELLSSTAGDYCPGCGRDASRYAIIDSRCGACQNEKIHFDGIARAGVYDGALRDLLLAFKFHDRTELSQILCTMADAALEGCFFRDRIDMIVPVPLHWTRRIRRGFNQSQIIAKGLHHRTAPICTDLVRIRRTQRQYNLRPAMRRRNVAGAFAVRKEHKFSGTAVCLVDDITTSGATLNECAKTLKDAGAANVFACVIAVARDQMY
jgi:ComF family protein